MTTPTAPAFRVYVKYASGPEMRDIVVKNDTDVTSPEGLKAILAGLAAVYSRAKPAFWEGAVLTLSLGDVQVKGTWTDNQLV